MENKLYFETVLMRFDNKDPSEIAIESQLNAKKYFENATELYPQIVSYYNYKLFLSEYKNVFWFDKKNREKHKSIMKEIGNEICSKFGCRYRFNGENYYTDCPIKIINIDIGFSMRGSEKYICSICGKSPIFCNHIGVGAVDNVMCQEIEGICNICCMEWGKCNHIENNVYSDVNPKKIVVDADVVTFDMVDDPEDPYCRITKIFYPRDYIEENIKESEFIYGVSDVYCNECLT